MPMSKSRVELFFKFFFKFFLKVKRTVRCAQSRKNCTYTRSNTKNFVHFEKKKIILIWKIPNAEFPTNPVPEFRYSWKNFISKLRKKPPLKIRYILISSVAVSSSRITFPKKTKTLTIRHLDRKKLLKFYTRLKLCR